MILAASIFLAALTQDKVEITEIKEGKGEVKTEAGDVVTVLYKGTLKDGTVFDQSTKDKPPFSFKLAAKQVIEGWDIGVLGMKVGGKRKLVIPSSLGYKDREIGSIPANSTLIFEIELLRIDKKDVVGKLELKSETEGKGALCGPTSKVTFHYTGSFLNGKKFDSSVGGEPLVIGVDNLIDGMKEALIGMKEGGKKSVIVPYNLGYKEKGINGVIPKYATLIFDFELVKVE